MAMNLLNKLLSRVLGGSRNERVLRTYERRVERVNELESELRHLGDAQLRDRTADYRRRIAGGERIGRFLPEALATGREVMDRAVGMRGILNPELGFDPDVLPEHARRLYAEVMEELAALEPVAMPGEPEPVPAWRQVEIPPALYEAVREAYPESRPPFRARPFDVQLIGAMILWEGRIAEMRTGEGKTIVAPLACYLASLEGLKCHVVTVNDYLVQRDRDWMAPFFQWLGLTSGAIHAFHMQPVERKAEAYQCDVIYGTNSEFGFDYLRDNMKLTVKEQVQTDRGFCIIDEVDSILIDEARTPLIISGPAHEDAPRYGVADSVARHLAELQKPWAEEEAKVQAMLVRVKGLEGEIRNTRDKEKAAAMRQEKEALEAQLPELEAARDRQVQYYEVELDKKAVHLTHEGVAAAQKHAGVGSFYVGENMDLPHLVENALKAHVVYQRDKDYVVKGGQVIIVDENTGRLMVGRQWSDGLHQAVEAKEKVEIKQETQTLATVTIQNFFKLYDRLAGMTGTAMTEKDEFMQIYGLEAIAVPTNVPVIREDRDDLVYLSAKDKWEAMLEEIRIHHDVGRPVLVGTTSVEKSEMLSEMLTRRHRIPHEVLNAKQHERESQIVAGAGALGAVMIATNMAGRGTDIKLAPVDREALVRHWQKRNILPKTAQASMDDAALIDLAMRHLGARELELASGEIEAMETDALRLALLRGWVREHGWQVWWPEDRWWKAHHWFTSPPWHDPERVGAMDEAACLAVLDRVPGFLFHRLAIFEHVEPMGGLHIVGTERHESRRIDNQLRGRAGRQGDRGSSRFFISLEDDLMSMFANKAVLNTLSKLGMKEGDAIESRMVTRSVEKAQRKVEQRNYEIRKNLLEYDDVMEYQRNDFYTTRQAVLEGRRVPEIIFGYIGGAVEDAVGTYLDRDYVPGRIADWCRQHLEVNIEPHRLRQTELDALEAQVRSLARADVRQTVEVTLGEYMSSDVPPEEWDTAGLSQWAMSRFHVDLKQRRIRQMNETEVTEMLIEAAEALIEKQDLSGLAAFVEPLFAERALAEWAGQKFEIEVDPETLAPREDEREPEREERVRALLLEKAREAYREREITYPVEFAMDVAYAAAEEDSRWAAEQMADWANRRYELAWTADEVLAMEGQAMRERLLEAQRAWYAGPKLAERVRAKVAEHGGDRQALLAWARERFGSDAAEEAQLEHCEDLEAGLLEAGRRSLRREVTQLERFVLLQIFDMAWKDHLYAMDQLKDSIGMRAYAQQDPRTEYKREGANLYAEMNRVLQTRVTDLVFRARLTPDVQARNVYQSQEASHDEAGGLVGAAAAAAAGEGAGAQQADQAAADRAGAGEGPPRRGGGESRGRGRPETRRPSFKKRGRKK